jgi:gas vesicle protein
MAYGEFEKSRTTDIFPAVVLVGVGVALGVLVGMLTAPAEGSKTRQRFGEFIGRSKEKMQHLRNQSHEQYEELAS